MRTNLNIHQWCWWLLVLSLNIPSIFSYAQFLQFCNQTLNYSSSPVEIHYFPSSNPSCCNLTIQSDSSSEQTMINIYNLTMKESPLRVSNKQNDLIKFTDFSSANRRVWKSDRIAFPISFSLCQFNLPAFEIQITDPTKESTAKMISQTSGRTIRGGIVTTTIIFGLLLIICSVSIALAFVYFRRKNQRRRQFTYSLESTSEDWEPAGGTGYHLFDNWRTHRRPTENQLDNVIIDANEHLPITTNMTTNR